MRRKVLAYIEVIQAVNGTGNFHVQIMERSSTKTYSLKDDDEDANIKKDVIVDIKIALYEYLWTVLD